jgi:hypothetical protein
MGGPPAGVNALYYIASVAAMGADPQCFNAALLQTMDTYEDTPPGM